MLAGTATPPPASRIGGQPRRRGNHIVGTKQKQSCGLAMKCRKRGITAIQPACQHTKGRHHHPHTCLHETGASETRTAMGNHPGRMIMGADFGSGVRFIHNMPEDNPPFFMTVAGMMAR